MGLLNLLRSPAPTLLRLPSGSFTVDRTGAVVTTTLPSHFPEDVVQGLARLVLDAFRDAAQAQLPLSELIADYSSLRITARALRGGAIIFVAPRVPYG
jgi:hypothetical protein